jgi:hypothetical protein
MDIQLSGGSDGVEIASLLRERFNIKSIITMEFSDKAEDPEVCGAVPMELVAGIVSYGPAS